MAIQCKGCGHFIQDGTAECPVCGGAMLAESNDSMHPQRERKSFFQESWGNLWHNRAELTALSPTEATLFKVAIGMLFAIFVSILFANR